MTSNFGKVKEFNRAFGVSVLDEPGIPAQDVIELRFSLVAEEMMEVEGEVVQRYTRGSISLVDLTKELCDLLYVTYGFLDALGVDADLAFEEVHTSNMSKLGPEGKPVLRDDGKVLKGLHYHPADIAGVIERQIADAHSKGEMPHDRYGH